MAYESEDARRRRKAEDRRIAMRGSVAKIDFNQNLSPTSGGKPRFLKGQNACFPVFATEPYSGYEASAQPTGRLPAL